MQEGVTLKDEVVAIEAEEVIIKEEVVMPGLKVACRLHPLRS